MRIAIIGSGSAAMQHYQAALQLNYEVALVSLRKFSNEVVFENISDCDLNFKPSHYVIANSTNLHYEAYSNIRNFDEVIPILCEKPLYFKGLVEQDPNLSIAFNLRFNSIIVFIANYLKTLDGRVNYVSLEYGRDLRTWRSNGLRDDSYSRFTSKGGGVLNDLCHEIDFLNYLFGLPSSLVSLGGSYSGITYDSPDLYEILFSSNSFDLARIHLDCISPVPYRLLKVISKDLYISADLILNTIRINSEVFKLESTNTFKKQLEAFVNHPSALPTDSYGMYLDLVLNAIEKSSYLKQWVELKA
jgi:predicted dehydrogenase